jgi:deglycase
VNPAVVQFTKAFFEASKPVFAICHAPQLLMTRARGQGADPDGVVDENLVTSRKPDDIPAFIRESSKLLERVPVASR